MVDLVKEDGQTLLDSRGQDDWGQDGQGNHESDGQLLQGMSKNKFENSGLCGPQCLTDTKLHYALVYRERNDSVNTNAGEKGGH